MKDKYSQRRMIIAVFSEIMRLSKCASHCIGHWLFSWFVVTIHWKFHHWQAAAKYMQQKDLRTTQSRQGRQETGNKRIVNVISVVCQSIGPVLERSG